MDLASIRCLAVKVAKCLIGEDERAQCRIERLGHWHVAKSVPGFLVGNHFAVLHCLQESPRLGLECLNERDPSTETKAPNSNSPGSLAEGTEQRRCIWQP